MRPVGSGSRALVVLAVLVGAVAAGTVPTTSGAFVAKVPSSAGTVSTNSAWTCADAVVQDRSSAVLAYSFDESSAAASSPGKAVDASGNGRDGTYTGERNKSGARGVCYRDTAGFPYVLKGSGTSAGTSGFVQTPSVTLSGAFSLELWFSTSTSTTAAAARGKYGFLLGSGSGADTSTPAANAVGLYLTADGRLVLGVAGGATTVTTPAGTSYADDYWYHVVATYSAADGASLYVNGHLVGTARPAAALPALTGAWRIGYGSPLGWPLAPPVGSFSGSLRFAAMYSTALSATAIAQHAAAGSGTRTSDNTSPDYRG